MPNDYTIGSLSELESLCVGDTIRFLAGEISGSTVEKESKMLRTRRTFAGIALMLVVGFSARVQAQAIEQVPSNATGVFEVKSLQGLSDKVAKLAKTLGVDQMEPKFADPLGSFMTEMGVKQGLNKNGDMAIAFFKPKKAEGADANANASAEPPLFVVLPVDDYKTFLGNFTDAKDAGGDVTEVVIPANQMKLYMSHRGKYAVASHNKAILASPGGFKLEGSAAKEALAKDALLYIDIKSLRGDLKDGYAKGREEFKKALSDNPQMGVKVPPFVFAIYDKMASELISGTKSLAVSFNLNDVGIGTAILGDFETDSYLGKLVSKAKGGESSPFAGLPDRPYLMYGAAKLTPDFSQSLFDEFSSILKENPGDMKKEDLDKYLAAAKKSLASMQSAAFGLAVPPPGENFVQIVELIHGDAKQMLSATKDALPYMNTIMGAASPKTKAEMKFGAPALVDGVELTPFTMSIDFDEKDAMAAQQKQIMAMMYGPNGLAGNLGAVNDKTFLYTMGVDPKILSEAIASAKANTDSLSQSDSLKQVAAELPKTRGAEFYIALDNIANTAVAVMKQQGLPVQFKLPANLPPIGFSIASDAATARMDIFIPTRLVESMTAAAMQLMMPNGGNKGI
jgi:hypothetical protein